MDDDLLSFKAPDEESNVENASASATDDGSTSNADVPAKKNAIASSHQNTKDTAKLTVKPPVYSLAKHVSSKWSTGTGPRISCVRDYPTELQCRALEQVNLSPRLASGPFFNYGPIPSPRPSPKVRLSPRIAHMGLPSPRTVIPAAH